MVYLAYCFFLGQALGIQIVHKQKFHDDGLFGSLFFFFLQGDITSRSICSIVVFARCRVVIPGLLWFVTQYIAVRLSLLVP